MKKLISGLLVVLALGAAAFFFFKARRYLPERPRAAEMVPVETLFFAQIPNLRESVQRFEKTGLHAIWQEPEVQSFLEKPRATAPQMRMWDEKVAQLRRLAPGEVFVAVTSIDGPSPRFVAGFSYAGSQAEAEALLAEPRAEFKRLWPAGKSDVESHQAATIETFTYGRGMIAECFVRNWYFVASEVPLLRATLDRYQTPLADSAASLAGNSIFQQTTAPLGAGLDFMIFGQLKALTDRLGSVLAAAGQPMGVKPGAEMNKTQAVAAGTKIEGKQLRDTIFLLAPGTPPETPLARRTLAFSAPETFLYYAAGLGAMAELPQAATALATVLPGFSAMDQALAAKGLKWDDFGKAFGPELGVTIDWPAAAMTPGVVVGFELRDAAKARSLIEVITAGSPTSPGWVRTEEAGHTFYSAPVQGITLLSAHLALSPQFALFGPSKEAVTSGLQRAEAAGTGLAGTTGYQEAAQLVSAPTSGFGYLNTGALFERAYRVLRPVITMSLAFSDEAGAYIDAGRLPGVEAVTKHLQPSVFSQSAIENGTLIESTGTLTFNQLLIGIAGGGVAAALPTIQSSLASGINPLAPGASGTPLQPPVAAPIPASPVVPVLPVEP